MDKTPPTEKTFGALKPVRIEGREYDAGEPVDRSDHRPEAIRRLQDQGYLGYPDDDGGEDDPAPKDANRSEFTTGRPPAPVPSEASSEASGK